MAERVTALTVNVVFFRSKQFDIIIIFAVILRNIAVPVEWIFDSQQARSNGLTTQKLR
jgi:hypothetical protein